MEFTFDLNTIWFMLIGVLLTGYAILDGFDLGVGMLHLFVKGDENRRILINSIGPVWDGNEVWLITGGGALFAAFPHVYATVFSGFYTALILLLFALIFRAIALEFRSKQPMQWWRQAWDTAFSVASFLIALLMGVALGNIITGVPIDPNKEFAGSFFGLLNPYALLVGIMTVSLFIMHGTIYAAMKTEGELQKTIRGWIDNLFFIFIVLYIVVSVATILFYPHMLVNFQSTPALFIVVLLNVLAVVNIQRELKRKREFAAFISSCVNIAALMIIFAIGIFPNIVLSNPNPENSLTIYSAASSQKTLEIMLIIACIGMPLVIAYTTTIYWVFRGKVKLDQTSY
jgi:cytochrome bd ubiquinol oxidase subunit II